jgi:NDP-sugar pyrophosphorylase family protein
MNPNLVILAGGIGSRMKKQLTATAGVNEELLRDAETKPKGLIGLGEGGRPFLDYLLKNIEEAGYRDVVIVTGERDTFTREFYGRGDFGNVFGKLSISYAAQPIPTGRTRPLGTADALQRALDARTDWAGQKFTVCNSDNLYSVNALRLLLESLESNAMIDYDRKALAFEASRIAQFAVIQKDDDGYLTNIVEKPSPGELAAATDEHGRIGVSMNIFRFSYDQILPELGRVPLHPVRMEKELPSAVSGLAQSRARSVLTIPLSEYVPDLTQQSDILAVQEFLKKMKT